MRPAHDDYSGHVTAGGPAARRTVALADGTALEITKMSVGAMDNNVYIIHAPSTGDTVLIDAADDADRIIGHLPRAGRDGPAVEAVVTTHRHADHWKALGSVVEATGARTMAGEEDADAIGHRIDRRLSHGDELVAGPIVLTVLHTPGHTPGSVCLLLEAGEQGRPHLFTGDTLFPGGPGNTFGSRDAFTTIMRSLRERVFALPDETWVYPGHGDDTTLGTERPHLPAWDARGW